jgi:hypothetical protein
MNRPSATSTHWFGIWPAGAPSFASRASICALDSVRRFPIVIATTEWW